MSISDRAEMLVSPLYYFPISVLLHFLLSFSGDLNKDHRVAVSCITNAPWTNRVVCLGKCDFFFFSHFLRSMQRR